MNETPPSGLSEVAAEMQESRERESRLQAILGRPLVVSLSEFLSEQPDIRPMIIGEGILPRSSLALLAGDSGAGKTSLAVQLALSVAAGVKFLDFEVGQCPVLFLEAEGSRDEFRKRVVTCIRSLGLLENLPIYFHSLGTMLSIESEDDDLLKMIRATEAGLVVLDTVGLFHDGEENSATEWKRSVLKPLRRLIGLTETAFLAIHHFGKPVEGKTSRHLIRGTSAMVGDVDSVFLMESAKTAESGRILKFEKLRHGARRESLVLRFDDGRATFERTGGDPVLATKPRLAEVQRIVLASGEMKTATLLEEIRDALHLGKSQAEDLIASAHHSGLISRPRRGVYAPPGGILLAQAADNPGLRSPISPPPIRGAGESGETGGAAQESPISPTRGNQGSRGNGLCSYFCGEINRGPCTRCGRTFDDHLKRPVT